MKSGLNWTPQRKSVFEVVHDATDHPTAADVMERLRERGTKLAYATVYNSLRYLTDAGAIQELYIGDGAARYDGRTDAHQHVLCIQCGRVDEVYGLAAGEFKRLIEEETGYRVAEVELVARGICPMCAKSEP